MAVPRPRSFSEIRKLITQVFVTKSGVNDLSVGSSIRDFIEGAAISDFKSQGDLIATLNSVDLDRAEGVDLDNQGKAKGVGRPQARPSTGNVTLSSTNFTKIATKIYAGAAAPAIGSTTINVSDASAFPQAGSVYLGRGSNNVEGPLIYTSITPVGNFFQINLSSPTTKNHNVNESVVLSQGGNRVVSVGTIVQTRANATSPSVAFRTLVTATIPDGEDSLKGVPVVCTEIGTRGNVPAGSIVSFASDPFPSAGVINETDYVTGRDVMSDPDYRLLIKNFEQNKTKGTPQAIESAATNVTAPDENKTSASAKLKSPSNRNEPGILYIDDGSGYQPIFDGQGFEQVVDNANGGEKYLQLQHQDITKALVQTSFTAPFALTGGMKLTVRVGGVVSEHEFSNENFATQNAADTFEVVNSINANTQLLFSARAVNNSKQIVLFAKNFENEDLEVSVPSGPTDVNANDFLGFSENLTYSLRLYKNDVLLIKDGQIPTIVSLAQANWSAMVTGETLNIKIDKSIYIQYTFNDADFVPFGYSSVASTNSLASWASVFNNKIAGITVTVDGNRLKFQSNKGANDDALIEIDSTGSSLAAKMFGFALGTMSDQGYASDYTLNRATAQLTLTDPLLPGDVVTAGSRNTRAFVDSAEAATGTINLPAASGTLAGPKLWVLIDAFAEFIQSTADAATQITITNPATNVWRFTSNLGSAFANVQVGDWVVISDDAIHAHDPDFIGFWRVSAVTGGYFEFYMTNSLGSTSGALVLQATDRITFVRSTGSMQQVNLLSGLQTLTALATDINTQLQGASASSVNGKVLRLTSNTYALSGSIMLAGITSNAQALGFEVGGYDEAAVTHTAFAESRTSEVTMPTFMHDTIATGTSAIPPINIVSSTSAAEFVNAWIKFLDPFDHQSTNEGQYAQSANITGTAITLRANPKLRDVLTADRYYPAETFNFEALDTLVLILDKDSVNKSLNIPMGRRGTVNGAQVPTQVQFRAYDSDNGPTANYPNSFGDNFEFRDFYLYFKARQLLDPAGANNKMILRAAKFGPTGQAIRFGIAYPTTPASPMTSLARVDEETKILVYLSSGSERLGGAWDSTTQFDVTNPAANTWRFTYNGIGTSPNFVGGAAIAIDDIVNIAIASNFSPENTGQFRIVAVTNTYFEVYSAYGVIENNIQLLGASDLRFFPLDAANNKATDVAAHVAANLSQYLSIGQLESGAGVITTSTWEDQAGSDEYVALVDGFNAVSSSNVGTTFSPQNQFNLKVALQILESDPNYTLVGEEFYIVPSNADQIKRFLNVFAVTGLSSLGNIGVSSDAGKIQIFSNLFGSDGAVLVSGGPANSSGGPVISTGATIVQANIMDQPYGIKRSGASTVTVYTEERHNLGVGDTVTISDVKNSQFNGTFVITAVTARTFQYTQAQPVVAIAASPTGAARATNIVTITTTTAHNVVIGDQVDITGVTDASFNGTFTVTSTPTSTSFTYAQVGANATSGSGNVTNLASGDGSVNRPYSKFTLDIANQAGLQRGQWIKLENQATQQKTTGFTDATALTISGLNTVTISGGPGSFQTTKAHSGNGTTQMRVERQGQFVCFTWTGTGTAPNFLGNNITEGDWVRITGNFNVVNEGIYKIERTYGANTFYIINDVAVEENVTLSAATDLRFYTYDSIMPGDQLIIDDDVLNAFNIGSYTVAESPFPTSTSFAVTPLFAINQGSTPLGSSFTSVLIKERVPYKTYKKVLNVTPDPANINGLVIVTENAILPAKVNISASSQISAVSKLDFKTTVQIGEDSYKYYLGLIHEVGKVIRGQAEDPIGYPGVAAGGSYIEISAPLPKRIQISIVIRNRTGVSFNTIKSRVQSAVASYINALGVGAPVVFSEIISVVQQINGIQAVSISSPVYNATNDQIPSNFEEKPVVLSLAEDVIVSLAT